MKIRILLLSMMVLSAMISCKKDNTTNPSTEITSVKICNQVWMTKNLDVDHYRNGDTIPEVRDSAQWAGLTTGAWCYYNNDPAMGAIYGKLYNWYAVNDPRGLAPVGWHVPSREEWTALVICLGGNQIAVERLKDAGTSHWIEPYNEATNESGFFALPGGRRYNMFSDINLHGYWWTATSIDDNHACMWLIGSSAVIIPILLEKKDGYSVRCVKD